MIFASGSTSADAPSDARGRPDAGRACETRARAGRAVALGFARGFALVAAAIGGVLRR